MNDAEVAAHFDGRPTVTLSFRGLRAGGSDYALALAHHFGYELVSAGNPHKGEYRLVFRLNNTPQGRMRAAMAEAILPPLPGSPPRRGWSPTPVHAGGEWVSPGEMATARRNMVVRGDIGPAPLVVFLCIGAAVLLLGAWNLRDDSFIAVAAALVLAGTMAAGAWFAPSWLRKMKRRDADLVARYDRQQASTAGIPPPPQPSPGNTNGSST